MPTPGGADQFFPQKHPRWKGLPDSQPRGLTLPLRNETHGSGEVRQKLEIRGRSPRVSSQPRSRSRSPAHAGTDHNAPRRPTTATTAGPVRITGRAITGVFRCRGDTVRARCCRKTSARPPAARAARGSASPTAVGDRGAQPQRVVMPPPEGLPAHRAHDDTVAVEPHHRPGHPRPWNRRAMMWWVWCPGRYEQHVTGSSLSTANLRIGWHLPPAGHGTPQDPKGAPRVEIAPRASGLQRDAVGVDDRELAAVVELDLLGVLTGGVGHGHAPRGPGGPGARGWWSTVAHTRWCGPVLPAEAPRW